MGGVGTTITPFGIETFEHLARESAIRCSLSLRLCHMDNWMLKIR